MNAAVQAVLLLLAVYATLGCFLWVLPAWWERMRAAQYRRETARIQGRVSAPAHRPWRPVRRVSLIAAVAAEMVVRATFWVVSKVLRLDRKAADRV